MSNSDLGTVYSANITSDVETGIGARTNDEVARAIREGIGKNDRPLFPIMPYESYRHLSDDDLAAVVVYIRSLSPCAIPYKNQKINFPISRLVLAVPESITEPVADPEFRTPRDRGKHLVRLASCEGCHTPSIRGEPLEGLAFAGGVVFEDLDGNRVASLNLTTDPTGIPYYDETTFIKTIRTGQIGARKINPVMPWVIFRNLNDDDLKGMFAFIHTLEPVIHGVDNSLDPTLCPPCGNEHGRGEKNKKR